MKCENCVWQTFDYANNNTKTCMNLNSLNQEISTAYKKCKGANFLQTHSQIVQLRKNPITFQKGFEK
jgi:hypothetical protein